MALDGIRREVDEVIGGNPAGHRVVVVAGDDRFRGGSDAAEGFCGKRTVSDDITEADDFLRALRYGVLQDRFKGLEVGVDIGDYGVFHRVVLYHICKRFSHRCEEKRVIVKNFANLSRHGMVYAIIFSLWR